MCVCVCNTYGYNPEENFHNKTPSDQELADTEGYNDPEHWYFTSWGIPIRTTENLNKEQIEARGMKLDQHKDVQHKCKWLGN